MPTWAEADEQKKVSDEKRKKANHRGLRTKGAVFIRNPGQDLAPVHAAEKENRRLKRTLKQREKEAEAANVVAKSKKAMMILELKKDGVPEYEAIAIAEQTFKDQAQIPKTKEQIEVEVRVNEEAKSIFAAWDDGECMSLLPFSCIFFLNAHFFLTIYCPILCKMEMVS
jgi:membrane carboxypeptidase/penicillin-binding protein